jgi:putative DNA primase/helicase
VSLPPILGVVPDELPPDFLPDENPSSSQLNGHVAEVPIRPTITVVAGRPDLLADEAESAIISSGLSIFQRGRELVRPAQFEVPAAKGRMTISAGMATLGQAYMIRAMAESANWEKWNARAKKFVPCDPPALPANILLASEGRWRFPPLAGVITAPTLRPDGSMLSRPGYDAATRLYHSINSSLVPEYVPDKPTPEQAKLAFDLLDDLLEDFPFTDLAGHSVALSCLMTPVLRGAIPVAPMHAIKASTAGTGKSYLIDVASAIANGRSCPVISVSPKAEETDSRFNGLLLGGFPMVSLDNVNGELGGDLLSQAITQPIVQVRRLGGSDIFEVESRATWFATGNGLRVKGDMTRRTIICNLDAGVERPEMRQFSRSPLNDVLTARGKYLAAVLTIARAYVAAGKPGRLAPPASFEEWSDLVRSPLVWLGCADPWATTESAREDDPELNILRSIVGGWAEAIGTNIETPVRKVINTANARGEEYTEAAASFLWPDFRDALIQVAGVKNIIDPIRLGKWLLGREGRIVDGLRFQRGERDTHAKSAQWRLELPPDQSNLRVSSPLCG